MPDMFAIAGATGCRDARPTVSEHSKRQSAGPDGSTAYQGADHAAALAHISAKGCCSPE